MNQSHNKKLTKRFILKPKDIYSFDVFITEHRFETYHNKNDMEPTIGTR